MFIIIPVNTVQDPEWGTDREMAPRVHLAFTLQLQEQSTFSISLLEKIEIKSQQVTQGGKKPKRNQRKTKQNKSKPYYERTTHLNNPALLEHSYNVCFLCSTLDVSCRKGKNKVFSASLSAIELLHYPSLQRAAKKKKLVQHHI